MFVLGNLIAALANLLEALLTIFSWLILIRVLVSWVNPDPFNPIIQFLSRATDPALEPLRRIIPPLGVVDISPVVTLLLIHGLKLFVIRTLLDLSIRLR